MTDTTPATPLGRRNLLRGSAILASAAAATAIAVRPAAADDGNTLTIGSTQTGQTTTSIELDGERSQPVLALVNDDGPALHLQPLPADWDGDLQVGDIANTAIGPLIGVDGSGITFLATGIDLDALPRPVPLPPTRLLDTRTSGGRHNILRSSAAAFDRTHRLKAGAWIDLAIDSAADRFTLHGAYLNLAATQALNGGHLTAYPPGPRPATSSLNYRPTTSVANGCFIAIDVVNGYFALRIYTSATTHVFVDLTGVVFDNLAGPAAPQTATSRQRRARAARTAPTRKLGQGRHP